MLGVSHEFYGFKFHLSPKLTWWLEESPPYTPTYYPEVTLTLFTGSS